MQTETQTDPRLQRDDPDFPRIATGTKPPGNNNGDDGGGGGGGDNGGCLILLCLFFAFGYIVTAVLNYVFYNK